MRNREFEPGPTARRAIFESFGTPQARKAALEMGVLLLRGDREGVNRILTKYFRRLGPLLQSQAGYNPHHGMFLFSQESAHREESWLYFFSPEKGGLYKTRTSLMHQGTADFGPPGPVLTWPPDKMGKREFARASVIALRRMVEEIKEVEVPRLRT